MTSLVGKPGFLISVDAPDPTPENEHARIKVEYTDEGAVLYSFSGGELGFVSFSLRRPRWLLFSI